MTDHPIPDPSTIRTDRPAATIRADFQELRTPAAVTLGCAVLVTVSFVLIRRRRANGS